MCNILYRRQAILSMPNVFLKCHSSRPPERNLALENVGIFTIDVRQVRNIFQLEWLRLPIGSTTGPSYLEIFSASSVIDSIDAVN